ncbi:tRNA (N6-threonylcarbamoyladenosine(37)-N6)-methyltransferase TrmO [Fuchsiella alkaliacetigena]|uniref:tRNA (N6-threonylcarbamoyladenosine(37)-N6)-methyltransferase TrmO n=1 Tax=Fuchsiella alkaliacetigena TaxID=957042 RepID=UPI00200B66E6|nr:tRNA (N6-threonylcarbamoyladenosine(37)-N6)-methyltransferase TrmO [Fuchsiella alkaliacetigena]MCK8824628.1 tRNA (N6-threonylcarbamoyladenosine(37)-N6)-methyltransferase TrmO [Fuchsiella alkaliacetigena]
MLKIESIGVVKSKFKESADPAEMRKHESTIEIKPEYEEGLYRIEESDYLQVIFNFHLAEGYELKAERRFGGVKGVFASRSPKRPSPLAITTVELLARQGNKLKVKGLDAIDGTPIVDIKPYAAVMDTPQENVFTRAELKEDPRAEIKQLIAQEDIEGLLIKSGELHGHFCPLVGLGVKVGVYALDKLGIDSDGMEEVLAIIETNSCFSDGVQYATGCSFGNNALIYRDYGKTAVTITTREGKAIRFILKEDEGSFLDNLYPEARELFEKVVVNREGSAEDKAKLNEKWNQISFEIIEEPIEELFYIEEDVEVEIPEYAPIFEDKFCTECGEKIMGPKAVNKEDGDYCISCSEESYLQLDGRGLNIIK